ncbi:MAG TPA: glycosyltransferase [Deltaproteobacteria bacterium]|nr:glycosyltransferase [Deltaproteobacteria bacterium]
MNRFLAGIKLAFSIIRITLRNDYDLFVLRLSRTGIFIPVLLSLLKKPYCIKTLGNVKKFNKTKHEKGPSFVERFLFLLFRKTLRNSLFIDVCTPQLEHLYRSEFDIENIEVIDNSVNTDRFYPLPRQECKKTCGLGEFDRIVGYCGGKPSQRGAQQLIKISHKLFERYPNAGIVIIGEDEDLDTLRNKVSEYGLADRIRFTGIVDYTELNPYLNCFDVGVALDTTRRIHLLGNSSQKIRQYIACGIPVICAKDTNEELIRKKLGTWISIQDTDKLFHDVCYWLDLSEEQRASFREKAREYAAEHLSCRVSYNKRYHAWEKALHKHYGSSTSVLKKPGNNT